MTFPYDSEGKVQSIINKHKELVVEKEYNDKITIIVEIDEQSSAEFIDNFYSISSGNINVKIIEK